MKIDTSTTAGKIEVMQASEKNRTIQRKIHPQAPWTDSLNTNWDWISNDYRIKPQTLNEAARLSLVKSKVEHFQYVDGYHAGAIFGAQWQREKDND